MRRNAAATVKLLQNYRRWGSQYRNSSNVRGKESGVKKAIGEDLIRIFYKVAACGLGYAIGGLVTSPEDPDAEERDEILRGLVRDLAMDEASADNVENSLRKRNLID